MAYFYFDFRDMAKHDRFLLGKNTVEEKKN